MSASSPNLKTPILIGVIAICGIAVTILNIKTFGSGAKPSRRVQATVQGQPALPPDLALLVHEAMAGLETAPAPGTTGQRNLPYLGRDPFQARKSISQPADTEVEDPIGPERAGLVCTAIMTGGHRPSALINGKFYCPGDDVDGHTLAWIGTGGVTLLDSQGTNVFLPLLITSQQGGAMEVNVGPSPQQEFNDK